MSISIRDADHLRQAIAAKGGETQDVSLLMPGGPATAEFFQKKEVVKNAKWQITQKPR
jgi:hypothetical protein